MRLTAFILISAAGALVCGWWRSFEAFCAATVFAGFAAIWVTLRRLRPDDREDAERYEPESPGAREFVLGGLLGLVWLGLTAGVIAGLGRTRVHGWFIDEPGQALAGELETLARNGAWSSIIERLDRPLPPRLGAVARTRIDKIHYIALTHAAAAIADPAASCAAQREAAAFAEATRIDSLDRVPVTCAPSESADRALADARIRVLKQEYDAAGGTVLSVAVTDASGAPLPRLERDDFLAVADGRQIPLARVTSARAVSPTRRFAIVSTPMRSGAHAAQAQLVRGVLSGMMRSIDRLEVMRSDRSSGPLPALTQAVEFVHTQPGGVVLFTEAESPLDRDLRAVMLQALQAAHVPLHVVIFGRGGKGRDEAEAMARDSGGRHVLVADSDVAGVRTAFSQPVAGKGVYFVALDGRYRRVTVALRAGAEVVK